MRVGVFAALPDLPGAMFEPPYYGLHEAASLLGSLLVRDFASRVRSSS